MITVVLENCAGLDVHRDMVMACAMWGAANQEAHWELQKFGTTITELQRLKAWLRQHECRGVVLESTGVYWEPVFNLLGEEWEEHRKLKRREPQGKLTEEEQTRCQQLAQTMILVTLATLRK